MYDNKDINTFVVVNATAFIVILMQNNTNAIAFKFISHTIMRSIRHIVYFLKLKKEIN